MKRMYFNRPSTITIRDVLVRYAEVWWCYQFKRWRSTPVHERTL